MNRALLTFYDVYGMSSRFIGWCGCLFKGHDYVASGFLVECQNCGRIHKDFYK